MESVHQGSIEIIQRKVLILQEQSAVKSFWQGLRMERTRLLYLLFLMPGAQGHMCQGCGGYFSTFLPPYVYLLLLLSQSLPTTHFEHPQSYRMSTLPWPPPYAFCKMSLECKEREPQGERGGRNLLTESHTLYFRNKKNYQGDTY